MLDGPRGDTHAAVLMPNGNVYVVSAKSGLKAILTSPLGGGRLLWERSTQTLWVESGDRWSSFPLAATIREPKETTARPALQQAAITAAGAVPQVIALSDVAPDAIVKVSPSAKYLLVLPEGPKSNAAVIRKP
jgi:hypothetical protein